MSSIGYKNHKVLKGMFEVAWHPFLIEVLLWMAVRYSKITLTSAHRNYMVHSKDSGIHMTDPLRAFDIDSDDFDNAKAIENDINAHFIYDPQRPKIKVAIYHDVGLGMHIHIQVHDRSKYAPAN